jgi:ABC-type multidrug transport system permease subunit
MKVVGRLFMRDIIELSRSHGTLALVFVVPIVLLLLIGNLKVRDPVLRVALVVDARAGGKSKPARVIQIESALKEIASLDVISWAANEENLREAAVRGEIDLVIVWENDGWRFRTPLTNSYRIGFVQAVVQDLSLSLLRNARSDEQIGGLERLALQLEPEPVPAGAGGSGSPAREPTLQAPVPPPALHTVEQMMQEVRDEALIPTPFLRAWMANRLEFFFPAGSQADRSLVPGFIALITVFLSFLLASGSLVREREAGTLETLIIVAGRNWARVAVAKLLTPIFVAMLAMALLLVAAQTAFGIGVKPGMLSALGVQLLAASVSALFGLVISTIVKSPQDGYTMASAYLVACILITGLIYPVEQAASAVAAVSYLFPLTLSAPPLENWMLKGANASVESWRWVGLAVQLAVALVLSTWALDRLRKRL